MSAASDLKLLETFLADLQRFALAYPKGSIVSTNDILLEPGESTSSPEAFAKTQAEFTGKPALWMAGSQPLMVYPASLLDLYRGAYARTVASLGITSGPEKAGPFNVKFSEGATRLGGVVTKARHKAALAAKIPDVGNPQMAGLPWVGLIVLGGAAWYLTKDGKPTKGKAKRKGPARRAKKGRRR